MGSIFQRSPSQKKILALVKHTSMPKAYHSNGIPFILHYNKIVRKQAPLPESIISDKWEGLFTLTRFDGPCKTYMYK